MLDQGRPPLVAEVDFSLFGGEGVAEVVSIVFTGNVGRPGFLGNSSLSAVGSLSRVHGGLCCLGFVLVTFPRYQCKG